MDFDAEISAPTATAAQPAATPPQPSPAPDEPGDVMLSRPADGGLFEPFAGSFDLGDLLAGGVEEVLSMHSQPSGPPAATQTGEPTPAAPPAPQKGTIVKLDSLHAAAAASFYVDVILPSAFSMLGNAIVGDGYRYKELEKNFKKTYLETVKILAQSGEVSMPTPMQCFVVMTLFITINNALEMWKVKKAADKTARRGAAKNRAQQVDESSPVDVSDVLAGKQPKQSDVSVEIARRTRFATKNGFYIYDLSGAYIAEKDRIFGPSKKVQEIINIHGTDAKAVKNALENAYKPSQASNA